MSIEYLVTGGAGFIGSTLVRKVCSEGVRVRVLDNLSTGYRHNLEDLGGQVELVEGDIRDSEALNAATKGIRYLFHFAALPSVIRSVEDPLSANESNITGALRMLLAARDNGVERVVFSSSSSVYGNTEELPKVETMLPSPLSPYALSKLAGEHYCRMFYELYGLKAFALRYFNVYGPRQDPKSDYAAVIPLFIDALREDRSPIIYGDGEQTRDFTFVDDVVSANLACRTAPDEAAGGVYNAARGDRISVNELFRLLAENLGKDLQPRYDPPRPGDVRDSQADATRARRLLNWKPQVTLEEGLKRTVEWFTRDK